MLSTKGSSKLIGSNLFIKLIDALTSDNKNVFVHIFRMDTREGCVIYDVKNATWQIKEGLKLEIYD